jgi:hypothetical protein
MECRTGVCRHRAYDRVAEEADGQSSLIVFHKPQML